MMDTSTYWDIIESIGWDQVEMVPVNVATYKLMNNNSRVDIADTLNFMSGLYDNLVQAVESVDSEHECTNVCVRW
jgi:hypothetical protein